MTFKELQKLIHYRQSETNLDQTRFFNRLKDKPFWIWNKKEHRSADIKTKGYCCFNHIIGLPVKGEVERPLYDYQKIVFDALEKHKHIFIKKSTGLGISEFFLRYICWLCLKDNALQGSQVCIITGPRIELAITLIDRMKKLFEPRGNIYFESKETVLELNGVRIEAFPSHHMDTCRGLPNPKFILIDEAAFLPFSQAYDARLIAERYIAKSDPHIVIVSTPNREGDLLDLIEKEQQQNSIYRLMALDYRVGLDKIFTREEIEAARTSPAFPREYDLQPLGLGGNTFSERSIQNAIFKGEHIPLTPTNIHSRKVLACDPGFGSSAFGVCICQFSNFKIDAKTNAVTSYSDSNSYVGDVATVLYAEEFEHCNLEALIAVCVNKMKTYGILYDQDSKVFVDAASGFSALASPSHR
jgi:hypothetical protein